MPAPKVKLPPPTTYPDDEPLVCVKINKAWIPYIIGALRPMRYPEYWAGTLEENRFARQNFALLIHQLSVNNGCEDIMSGCDCFEEITTTILHQVAENDSGLEISVDNGETWVSDPADPRSAIVSVPSSNTPGAKAKCDAADNIRQALIEAQAIISSQVSVGGTIGEIAIEIAVAILGLLLLGAVGAALLIPLIVGVVRVVLQIGQANYDGLFTTERWDIVRCAFFCALEDDGHLTAQGMEQAKRYIYKHIPGDNSPTGSAQNHVDIINFVGLAGLNLVAMTYQPSGADCTDCECDPCEFDIPFDANSYHWLLTSVKGFWELGDGWKNTQYDGISEYYLEITIPLDGCVQPFIELSYHHEQAPFDHKGINYQFENPDTGELVWTDNGFNLPGGGTDEVVVVTTVPDARKVWAIRITMVSVNGLLGKKTMWLKRVRWNETGVFV